VSVTGPLDVDTQMIVDLATLDRILADAVTSRVDGRSLNDAVPSFASGEQLPSCEAIAQWVWGQVAPRLPNNVRLHRVRVAEDETLWADCIG
jgi:6-pyruvoyl-tetrahydropterin synthase